MSSCGQCDDDDVRRRIATKGIEVAAAVSPVDGLKLWGNAAYTHARFVNFDCGTGNTPPNVAPVIINAGASYRSTIGDGRRDWRLGAPCRKPFFLNRTISRRWIPIRRQTSITSWTFPARILRGPEIEKLRVTFRVRNLTNAVYAAWSDTTYADQIFSARRVPMRSPPQPSGKTTG